MDLLFDRAWHERALQGDPQALARLCDETIATLYQFVHSRTGGQRTVCEDIVQDIYSRALADLPRYDPDRGKGRILPWLRGIAMNEIRRSRLERGRFVSLDHLRDRFGEDGLAMLARLEQQPLSDRLLAEEETRTLVVAVMARLPDRYRELLEAIYARGRTVRQLADEMKLTEEALESLLGRARGRFREQFMRLVRRLKNGEGRNGR